MASAFACLSVVVFILCCTYMTTSKFYTTNFVSSKDEMQSALHAINFSLHSLVERTTDRVSGSSVHQLANISLYERSVEDSKFVQLAGLSRSVHQLGNMSLYDGMQSVKVQNSKFVQLHFDQYSNMKSKAPSAAAYLLVLGYEEQLTFASRNMLQLAPLAADWHAQLVTPVVVGSHLFGIPGLVSPQVSRRHNFSDSDNTTEESIRLEKIYNIPKLNELFHGCVSKQLNMVSFEEFISYAPKDITLLHFNDASASYSDFHFSKHDAELVKKAIRKQNVHIADCSAVKSAAELALDIEEYLNHYLSESGARKIGTKRFKVVKTLCLDPYSAYQSTYLQQHMKQNGTPGTIIFTVWRGCIFSRCSLHYKAKYSSYNRNPGLFRFAVFTENDFNPPPSPELLSHLHQPDLLRTAKAFLERIGIHPPFLSIHVRSERIAIDGSKLKRPYYYDCCMKQLKKTVDRVRKEYSGDHERLLLITDKSSQYGTDTCQRSGASCKTSDTDAITDILKSFNWTIVHYDPVISNGVSNSGYVSLVEMSMLSLGEKLILVGRGSFQEVLQQKFLSHKGRTKADVYHICHNKHC